MNNWDNVKRCLNSIYAHTSVTYEILMVAYMFSADNMSRLKSEYPRIKVIESNEIRGFSENNNLALRQAKGRYSLILNDDTELAMPAIDLLVATFDAQPADIAIVSPVLLNSDGSVQVCGRPPMTWKTFILDRLHLWSEKKQTDYINKTGIFTSYNIIGAAFLIRTDLFRKIGWFDETYFFTPEDIALSTKLNNMGYRCLVDTSSSIIHFGGMTGRSSSMIQAATIPAGTKGALIMYSEGHKLIYHILALFMFLNSLATIPFNILRQMLHPNSKEYKPMIHGYWNVVKSIFSKQSPKEIFIRYYKKTLP